MHVTSLASGMASWCATISPATRQASSKASPKLAAWPMRAASSRSEEHTSELQSLMRISYAVFCLKTKQSDISSNSTNNIQTKADDTSKIHIQHQLTTLTTHQ